MRLPPSWSPERQEQYPFRQWVHEVMIWSIMKADLNESRKAAAILSQLRGAAAEFAREIPPQIIVQGGVVNGTPTDPMTYLIHALAENYSALGEEQRLHAMTEMMSFQRKPGELTDQLLTRFDSVRMRAIQQGQLNMSIQGLTWLLLRAIGISDNDLINLL